jgi:hypothetical protein
VSAVFGREPSRPLPSDVEGEPDELDEAARRDKPIEAVVVDERDAEPRPDAEPVEPVIVEVPEGEEPRSLDEPEPMIDLRDDEDDDARGDALDVEDLDTEPEPVEPSAEEPELEATPEPVPAARADTEPEPDADPEPEPEPEPVAAEPAPVTEEPEPVAGAGPAEGWDRRWDDVQATFVDDPRSAVNGAAALLSEALAEATPTDAGTEDLRVAFRRYRAAFRDLHPTA